MNFTKILALVLTAALFVSLCGCNGNKGNDPASDSTAPQTGSGSVSESSSEYPSENDPESVPVSGTATFLIGADGAAITADEIISAVNSNNEQIPLDTLTEENFSVITTDCAYYAKPLYPCVTDRDNEYDEENLKFKDIPQETKSDFIKVKKGDKIFGMTVTEASSDFNLNSPVPGVIVGTNLALEGEITLTGYIRVVPDNEYGVSVGDILFIPTGKIDLPVVHLDDCDTNGVITHRTGDIYIMEGKTDSLTYTNEYANKFTLGSINDTTANISDIPTDGSFVKASVTVSDITMSSTIGWMTFVRANLVSVDVQ